MGPISYLGVTSCRGRFQRIGGDPRFGAGAGGAGSFEAHLSAAADGPLVRGGDVPLRLAGAGQETLSGAAIGITLSVVVGAPPGDMHTALWRSGDVIFGSLLAMRVYRHLAAAGVHPLAHPDGQLCHQL